MPRVTAIEVGFRRTRQPAQYETAEAEVKLHLAVDDGEVAVDVAAFAGHNLDIAKSLVLARLGLQAATGTVTMLAASAVAAVAPGPTPAVATATPSSAPASGAAAEAPKVRTRRTKAQIEADNALAATAAGAQPAQTTVDPADMTQVASSAAASAAPAATASDKPVTDAELQKAAMTAASRLGQTGPTKVRAVIKEFGVRLLSEVVGDERRRDVIAKLGALT